MYRLIWRGKNSLAQLEKIERNEKYRIDIGAYGSIAIEAPTKEECLEFMEMRVAMELGMVDYIYRRKTPDAMLKLAESVSDPLEYQTHLEQEIIFHQRLFAISGNSIAYQFCSILNNAFKLLDYQPVGKRKTPSHKEIWETLDSGSLEDFRTVMLKHFSPYIK